MRRRITITFSSVDEPSYHMALGIIMRQLQRGQVRGDGVTGLGAWHYEVTTEHPSDPEERDDEHSS
jgi:hypothetical protein